MTTPRKTSKATHSNPPAENAPVARPTKSPFRGSKKDRIEPVARPGTKQANLTAVLRRAKGATVAQMCAKAGWQIHSVRAVLTGLRRRGCHISRQTNNACITVYRIASQRNESPS